MQHDGLAWFTGLLALLALFIAARILFSPNWFLAWLRGTAGLAFLALALLVGVVAYDLRSYDAQVQDKPLVTLSFVASGGKTLLRLSHRNFESASARDAHKGGWAGALACLAAHLAKKKRA